MSLYAKKENDFNSFLNAKGGDSNKNLERKLFKRVFKSMDLRSKTDSFDKNKLFIKANTGFQNFSSDSAKIQTSSLYNKQESSEKNQTRKKIFLNGKKNYTMLGYHDNIFARASQNNNNFLSYRSFENNMPSSEFDQFKTERKIGEREILSNVSLKQKIENKIQQNRASNLGVFLTSFSCKYNNNPTKLLQRHKKSKQILLKNSDSNSNRAITSETLVDFRNDRKFGDFFDLCVKNEFQEGKIILIIENHNLDVVKMKSNLKYFYCFIRKVETLHFLILFLFSLKAELQNPNRNDFHKKFIIEKLKIVNKTNVLYSLSGKMITSFLDFTKEEYTFVLSFYFHMK